MESKSFYITVVDKLGREVRIPRAGLEQYKKQLEEWKAICKKLDLDTLQLEIAEILDE